MSRHVSAITSSKVQIFEFIGIKVVRFTLIDLEVFAVEVKETVRELVAR